jgi:hypothetical protein
MLAGGRHPWRENVSAARPRGLARPGRSMDCPRRRTVKRFRSAAHAPRPVPGGSPSYGSGPWGDFSCALGWSEAHFSSASRARPLPDAAVSASVRSEVQVWAVSHDGAGAWPRLPLGCSVAPSRSRPRDRGRCPLRRPPSSTFRGAARPPGYRCSLHLPCSRFRPLREALPGTEKAKSALVKRPCFPD